MSTLQRLQDFFVFTLSPSLPAIIFTFILAVTLPLLLHSYTFRKRDAANLPAFLLVGPSGAGKTALLTLFERGIPAQTHTSQTPITVECDLPVDTVAASNQYRSQHDPSNEIVKKFVLIDTPGHGKLRHFALNNVVDPTNLKGIIFVADAATLSNDTEDLVEGGLTEAAEYLHDILLTLQKRYTNSKTSKGPSEMPVLIAANKLDLFTALPAKLVGSSLEAELTKIRTSRSKGLLDSGIGMDDDMAEDRETLGGAGEGSFKFAMMEEYNVPIEVAGGNVTGAEGANVDKWWAWIGNHL